MRCKNERKCTGNLQILHGIIHDCAFLHDCTVAARSAETFHGLRRACMKPLPSTEHDLIERARQHDEAAFAALVEQYAAAVYRIIHRMMPDRMEAEAIVQETFWRFWRALPGYSAEAPLLPYLATIASNLTRDRFRRERRLDDLPAEEVLDARAEAGARDVESLVEDQ